MGTSVKLPETSWIGVLTASLAVVLAWQVWSRIRQRVLYDLHKIPGPRPLPLIGNLHQIVGTDTLQKTVLRWTKQYGGIFREHIGTHPAVLVISDPEEVARLSSREENVPKWHTGYRNLRQRAPHFNILATPDQDDWKHVRKTTNLAFSPNTIREGFPVVYHKTLNAAEALDVLCKHGLVDVNDLAWRFTAETIMAIAFEEEMHALKLVPDPSGTPNFVDEPYLQHLKVQLKWMTRQFINPVYHLLLSLLPWLPTARSERTSCQAVDQADDAIAAKIRAKGRQPESNTTLWACLSRLVNHKDSSPMHPQKFAANTGQFFWAGHDTTSNTITWCLFELAADPATQAEVREELVCAGLAPSGEKPEGRPLQFSDLSKLPVLEAVVKEAMRLHPTAPMGTAREAVKDMVVGGYRVPKGTVLSMPPYALQLSPHNFTAPDKFWPGRWLKASDNPEESDSDYPDATPMGNRRNIAASWNAFSMGPRNCSGQPLALMKIKTTLAVLLSRFSFALPEGVQREKFIAEEEVWWITLQVRHGLKLRVGPVSASCVDAPSTPPQDSVN
ncbi:hypothetical protein ABBQ32_005491 [Trebouxia sp. C0010 RCD-2024]